MPWVCTDSFSRFQSSWSGMRMSASANNSRTRSVAGSHTCSVYLSKTSPEAYFEFSKYASGEFFDKYTEQVWEPATERVRELFADADIRIPDQDDWKRLKESVAAHGIYNQNLQAVPPTGSISYI